MPGKRKLRFDVRKKRLCTAGAYLSAIPTKLYIRLPITSYLSGRAQSLDILYRRCRQHDVHGWTCSIVTGPSLLVFIKICPNSAPSVLYTVTVSSDFTWNARRGDRTVPSNCGMLDGVPCELHSVESVISLLTQLEMCKLCSGNNDAKFLELAAKRQGKFMDQSGACIIL